MGNLGDSPPVVYDQSNSCIFGSIDKTDSDLNFRELILLATQWEILETFRKLFMTSLVSVVSTYAPGVDLVVGTLHFFSF